VNQALPILYRDEHCIAVVKPAGLLVHRSAIDSRQRSVLVQLLRDQIGQQVYPVHRLDRPTQGVIVLGLSSAAARLLQEALSSPETTKTYLAVTRGYAPPSADVDHPLRDIADARDTRREQSQRDARTRIVTLQTIELPIAVGDHTTTRASLVECQPATGRRHQIRRHLKHLRHPVIGDSNYGDGRHNRVWRDQLGIRGLLLAATGLEFRHPYSGARVSLETRPAGAMQEALALSQWQPR